MKKEKIVLDTSVFVNPASGQAFGKTPTDALMRFLEMAEGCEAAEFVMPPSVYAELMHFAEETSLPKRLLLAIKKTPPKKHETKIPGIFLYNLVESMRDRVDRGLRLSERHVREALEVDPPPKGGPFEKGKVRPDAELINRLRESYRRIMREGMLDSKMDADLLLLAYEVNGTLVSADQGVIEWADDLGIRTLPYDHLADYLKKKKA